MAGNKSAAAEPCWLTHLGVPGGQGGRFFLQQILDAIKPLQQARRKMMVSDQFHKDLNWWLTYLDICNGWRYYNDHAEEHVLTGARRVASGCF